MSGQIVGVLGGMGPEATVDLMNRVIRATPAEDDADHIRLLIDNNPKVPSRIKAIIEGQGEDPAPCLVDMARGLERMGADFLVMPCNTAHHYYQDIAGGVGVPVVNLIELTAEAACRLAPGLQRAGMLASTAVQMIGLYDHAFAARGAEALFPSEPLQVCLMRLIRRVKSDSVDDSDIDSLHQAARDLETRGAECLIIACTELSVVASRLQTDLPVIDAAQALAEHIVQRALPGSV
jgi:aspartate racemase